jgi:hypothetical protein
MHSRRESGCPVLYQAVVLENQAFLFFLTFPSEPWTDKHWLRLRQDWYPEPHTSVRTSSASARKKLESEVSMNKSRLVATRVNVEWKFQIILDNFQSFKQF